MINAEPLQIDSGPLEIEFVSPGRSYSGVAFRIDLLTKLDELGVIDYKAIDVDQKKNKRVYLIDYGQGTMRLPYLESLPWLSGYVAGLRANEQHRKSSQTLIEGLGTWIPRHLGPHAGLSSS